MQKTKEGVTEDTINKLINAETWKNGEEWQEYFNIEVTEKCEAAACESDFYEQYKNMPENKAVKPPITDHQIEMMAQKIYEKIHSIEDKNKDENEKKVKETADEILEDLDYI
jgi:nicotinamide mononucleotide adenylyltransferase